jgi:AraC-like DNA-binding protein
MHSRPALLSNFPLLKTNDPEQARRRLASLGLERLEIPHSENRFGVRCNHLQMTGIGLNYSAYAGDVSLEFSEASFVRQIFNIDGIGRYAAGAESGEITRGSWSPVIPTGARLRLEFSSGYRQLALRIEIDALKRHLAALIGQEVDGLAFDRAGTHPPAMSSLRRRVFQFATDFNERGRYFSDLAATEVERMVIMNFLMCHRHNYTELLLREPPPASSTAVRAVEEFIEANWDRPIDVPAMARVAKVSARSLFRQFKKDRGYSPADFAKQMRLNRAREMLEQPAQDSSVTQIALRCGFQNPGHFARDFRLAFGELPSETLRKATRRRHG